MKFTMAKMVTVALVATQGVAMAETLQAPMPAGFKIGFRGGDAGQPFEERVPVAETVDVWTRMITVQRFDGLARLGPHAFLERLGALMTQACPGAGTSPIVDEAVDGRPTATMRVDCPTNPATGKPETMFARAFRGTSDLHSVQYAFRSLPSSDETSAAEAYLKAVTLCPGASPICR